MPYVVMSVWYISLELGPVGEDSPRFFRRISPQSLAIIDDKLLQKYELLCTPFGERLVAGIVYPYELG